MGIIGRKSSISKVSVKTEKHTIVGIMAISCMLAANDEDCRIALDSDRSFEKCPESVQGNDWRFTSSDEMRIHEEVCGTEDIRTNAANNVSIPRFKRRDKKTHSDNLCAIHSAVIVKDEEVNGQFTIECDHTDDNNWTIVESQVVAVHHLD